MIQAERPITFSAPPASRTCTCRGKKKSPLEGGLGEIWLLGSRCFRCRIIGRSLPGGVVTTAEIMVETVTVLAV
jgi:hypothetical protein